MTVLLADDDGRIGINHMPYPVNAAGLATLSYGAEPLKGRNAAGDSSSVFSSLLFGDPKLVASLPTGAPITFRVAMPWGQQGHVFAMEGHRFPYEVRIPGAEQIYSENLVPGTRFDAPLIGGAGSGLGFQGDYLVYDARAPFLEAGLWSLLRVTPPAP
jgi:hypothetical protein